MLSLIWPNTRSTQPTNTSYFKIDRPKNGGTFLGIRKKHLYSISPHLLVYSILDTTRYFKLYHISFSQFFWILCPQSKIIWVWNPFFVKRIQCHFVKYEILVCIELLLLNLLPPGRNQCLLCCLCILTLMDEIVTLGSICMQHVFDYRAEAMHSVTKYKCLVCSYSLKSSLFSKYCCIIIM